jgi:hypothetical protein
MTLLSSSSQDRDEVRARLAFLSARLNSARKAVAVLLEKKSESSTNAQNSCCMSAASTCLPEWGFIFPAISKTRLDQSNTQESAGVLTHFFENQHAARVGSRKERYGSSDVQQNCIHLIAHEYTPIPPEFCCTSAKVVFFFFGTYTYKFSPT